METQPIEAENALPSWLKGRVVTMRARWVVQPRTDLSRRVANRVTLFWRATSWAYPWSTFAYPGHLRGICLLLGKPINKATLYYWKKGDRPPVWVAQTLAAHIRARSEAGLALAGELEDYIRKREAEIPRKPVPPPRRTRA